jgi:hypothetical protein
VPSSQVVSSPTRLSRSGVCDGNDEDLAMLEIRFDDLALSECMFERDPFDRSFGSRIGLGTSQKRQKDRKTLISLTAWFPKQQGFTVPWMSRLVHGYRQAETLAAVEANVGSGKGKCTRDLVQCISSMSGHSQNSHIFATNSRPASSCPTIRIRRMTPYPNPSISSTKGFGYNRSRNRSCSGRSRDFQLHNSTPSTTPSRRSLPLLQYAIPTLN